MSDKERLQLENELLMNCSKAQMIEKYIDELEENSKLSELWCKSQEENQKYKEVIDKAIEYMKEFIFEPLLTNEDRKLIMYNDNLRNFEKILKEVE